MLAGCSFAAQQLPTATATFSPTDTPTANLTATQEANQAATQTMWMGTSYAVATQRAEPTLTAVAYAALWLDDISKVARDAAGIEVDDALLYLGPRDGEIDDKDDDFVGIYETGLSLENFVVSIKFINPYDTATVGKWDYGLFFRDQSDREYRLAIFSNQSWDLLHWEGDDRTYIYRSNDKNLTAKEGEENTIWLIVIDKEAHLFINGIHAQTMSLGDGPSEGGLFPATGFYYGNASVTGSTRFREFTVWKLP
jgi:hypothetical protein